MIFLPQPIRKSIEDHAQAWYPRESCGLLLQQGATLSYFPCRNIADHESDFVLCPEDFAAAEDRGQVLAVVHSHPDAEASPSSMDVAQCNITGVPWLIVSYPKISYFWVDPIRKKMPNAAGALPLVGRTFEFGVVDCYTLVRDYYYQRQGLVLNDYRREDRFWEKGQDLYRAYFELEGFVRAAGPPEVGDAFLIQFMGSPVPQHAGVYAGDGMILHHLPKRLSRADPYSGYWDKHTVEHLRYGGAQ